jgi:lysylphosphatidylglycerol synthetase-like protein (DUF2156 family)
MRKMHYLTLLSSKNYHSSILTQKKSRPIGVTIIAILAIISGILLLASGLALTGSGALLSFTATTSGSNNPNDFQSVGPFIGMILLITGIALLIIGIGYLVVSYGLLKGKGWAWKITIVLTILSIAVQVISGISNSIVVASITNDGSAVAAGLIGQIIGISINLVILYYLYRPHVRAFFGKSSKSTN